MRHIDLVPAIAAAFIVIMVAGCLQDHEKNNPIEQGNGDGGATDPPADDEPANPDVNSTSRLTAFVAGCVPFLQMPCQSLDADYMYQTYGLRAISNSVHNVSNVRTLRAAGDLVVWSDQEGYGPGGSFQAWHMDGFGSSFRVEPGEAASFARLSGDRLTVGLWPAGDAERSWNETVTHVWSVGDNRTWTIPHNLPGRVNPVGLNQDGVLLHQVLYGAVELEGYYFWRLEEATLTGLHDGDDSTTGAQSASIYGQTLGDQHAYLFHGESEGISIHSWLEQKDLLTGQSSTLGPWDGDSVGDAIEIGFHVVVRLDVSETLQAWDSRTDTWSDLPVAEGALVSWAPLEGNDEWVMFSEHGPWPEEWVRFVAVHLETNTRVVLLEQTDEIELEFYNGLTDTAAAFMVTTHGDRFASPGTEAYLMPLSVIDST